MKKILTFFIAYSISLTAILAQSRNVHWIHGLGGDVGSWVPFVHDFHSERQIGIRTHAAYNTANGVRGMVSDIQQTIGYATGGNCIAIAHSMGGVASRHLDVNNNGTFGAIITFGAPLRGARVANNVNNGVAANYISNAIYRLTAGPLGESVFQGWFSSWFEILNYQTIQDFAGEKIVESIRNTLSLTNTTVNDLAEESSYNQNFYSSSTGTPKLIFWGNENSPMHVRLAAAMIGANEEQWVDRWNFARQQYGANRDYANFMKWFQFPLFSIWNWRAGRWAMGYDYLWDQSENEWANLIGGGYTYQQTVGDYVFVGINLEDYDNCIVAANGDQNQMQGCHNTYFQWVTYQVTLYGRDQTDGLVPRRSQIAENTAWSSNADIRELPGNNHQEMRRSSESRAELNAAFDGSRAGGDMRIDRR